MKQLVVNTVIKEHLYHIQKGGCKVFIWLDFLVFTFNNIHYLNVSATTVGGTAGSVAGPQLQGPWFNPECGVSYAVFEWVSPGFYGVQKHAGKQIDYGKKFPLSVNMHVNEALQWTGINVNSPASVLNVLSALYRLLIHHNLEKNKVVTEYELMNRWLNEGAQGLSG